GKPCPPQKSRVGQFFPRAEGRKKRDPPSPVGYAVKWPVLGPGPTEKCRGPPPKVKEVCCMLTLWVYVAAFPFNFVPPDPFFLRDGFYPK
ncbi:hypothetical protein CRENBAI_025842, partial [Crenichthys baileyi]